MREKLTLEQLKRVTIEKLWRYFDKCVPGKDRRPAFFAGFIDCFNLFDQMAEHSEDVAIQILAQFKTEISEFIKIESDKPIEDDKTEVPGVDFAAIDKLALEHGDELLKSLVEAKVLLQTVAILSAITMISRGLRSKDYPPLPEEGRAAAFDFGMTFCAAIPDEFKPVRDMALKELKLSYGGDEIMRCPRCGLPFISLPTRAISGLEFSGGRAKNGMTMDMLFCGRCGTLSTIQGDQAIEMTEEQINSLPVEERNIVEMSRLLRKAVENAELQGPEYIKQINAMRVNATAWRKANPDKEVQICFHHPPNVMVSACLDDALEQKLITANEAGMELLKALWPSDDVKTQPTILMVRVALETDQMKT